MNTKTVIISAAVTITISIGVFLLLATYKNKIGPQPAQLNHETIDLSALKSVASTLQTNAINNENLIWAIGQNRVIGYDSSGTNATISWPLPASWNSNETEILGVKGTTILLSNKPLKITALLNTIKGSVTYLPNQTFTAQFVSDNEIVIYTTDSEGDLPHLVSYKIPDKTAQEFWQSDHPVKIQLVPTNDSLFIAVNDHFDTGNSSLYRYDSTKRALETVLTDIGYIYSISPDSSIIYYNTFEGNLIIDGISQPQNISHYRNLKTGEDKVVYPWVDLRYTAWQDNKLYTYSLQDSAYHPVKLDKQNMTKLGTDQYSAVTAILVDKKPEVIVNTDTGVHQINL